MLYCSRLRQEPCCPPGPNPPSRGAVSKKYAKSAISALFIFRRFFVFPYRFPHFVPVRPLRWPTRRLLRFWRLRYEGRTFCRDNAMWPPFLCAESAVSDLSYFLLLTAQQRIVTFGPSQDCAASRQHFDGAFTCIRSIFFVVRCNQNGIYRAEENNPLRDTPQFVSSTGLSPTCIADRSARLPAISERDGRRSDGRGEG